MNDTATASNHLLMKIMIQSSSIAARNGFPNIHKNDFMLTMEPSLTAFFRARNIIHQPGTNKMTNIKIVDATVTPGRIGADPAPHIPAAIPFARR